MDSIIFTPGNREVLHMCVQSLRHVQLFETLWTVAHQASLFMGFLRQEDWSGLPFPSPGDLPDSRIKPTFPALASRFFIAEPLGKPTYTNSPSFSDFLLV